MEDRYHRHRHLFSEDAFARIRRARIFVAGAGGLGSTVLQLLVRGGIGTIHVCDHAALDLPDLNRQLLYATGHLGQRKVDAACDVLRAINPEVTLIPHDATLTRETPPPEVDAVVDCLDTFAGRFLLDDLFFRRGVPLIHGGVAGFFGQVTTLIPGKTQSLQELFGNAAPANPPGEPLQVFPPAVTAVASLLAAETFKLAAGQIDRLLLNRLLTLDFVGNALETIALAPPLSPGARPG